MLQQLGAGFGKEKPCLSNLTSPVHFDINTLTRRKVGFWMSIVLKKTTIYYYITATGDNPIKDFLDSLSEKQQVKILRVFQYIQEYGLHRVLPHVKKLKGIPFWEIRILGKDSIRVIYAAVARDSIVILHGFIKKTVKTSQKELNIALNRHKDWRHTFTKLD